MQPAAVIRILKPNVTSLGYALFLAINAAGVWGGVFPFLPLEFQTPEIVFWFFLAQSLVFSASYFASAFGVYFLPGPTRRFMVMLAAAPYFLGWCCLIAAIYLDAWALPLVVVGGGLLVVLHRRRPVDFRFVAHVLISCNGYRAHASGCFFG